MPDDVELKPTDNDFFEKAAEAENQDVGIEDEQQQETVEEAPEGDLGSKGDGTEHVDLNQEQQDRFNRLFRQIKAQDRKLENFKEHNEKLRQRMDAQDQKHDDAVHEYNVTSIESQLQKAYEEGDYDSGAKLTRQLINEEAKKLAPKPQAAPQTGGLTDYDMQTITEWQGEISRSGNFLRQWAQQNHP